MVAATCFNVAASIIPSDDARIALVVGWSRYQWNLRKPVRPEYGNVLDLKATVVSNSTIRLHLWWKKGANLDSSDGCRTLWYLTGPGSVRDSEQTSISQWW